MVDGVWLHLVQYLKCIRKCFGHIGEDFVHLFARLEPLQLGVEHTVGVVKVFASGQTQQVVVGFGIVLVDKVAVVGADKLYAILLRQLYQFLVGTLLQRECFAVGTLMRVLHLVTLKFQIIVVAKHALIPFNCFARSLHVAIQNLGGHFAGNTCRAYNKVFVISLQVLAVGTRTHIISIHPCT